MRLLIKDREFQLESGMLGASIPDPYWARKFDPHGDPSLSWAFEFEAKQREFDGELWQPNVMYQGLRFPIRRWFEIPGQEIDESEPNASLYVFEHGPIHESKLRFLQRDGVRIRVSMEGLCGVFWNDEFDDDVPFSLDGWATFNGVIVHGSEHDTEQSIRSRLESYLYGGDFEDPEMLGPQSCYEDGVRILAAEFAPRKG